MVTSLYKPLTPPAARLAVTLRFNPLTKGTMPYLTFIVAGTTLALAFIALLYTEHKKGNTMKLFTNVIMSTLLTLSAAIGAIALGVGLAAILIVCLAIMISCVAIATPFVMCIAATGNLKNLLDALSGDSVTPTEKVDV
jgi:hypothetical protein